MNAKSSKTPIVVIILVIVALIGCCITSAVAIMLVSAAGVEEEVSSGAGVPSSGSTNSPLVGAWEFISTGVLTDFVDSSGNVVGGDGSGSGTRLEFQPNGTYAYHYYARSGGILSGQIKAMESGQYIHSGTTLELRPASIDGTAQFGDGTPEPVKFDPTPRTYQLTANADRTAIEMKGPCAQFLVDTWCPIDDAERIRTPVSTTWKRAR